MSVIFYGLPGEGLGHACRTQAMIEHLNAEVHVFTWGEAYEFFKKIGYPRLHKIAALPFGRNKNNSISVIGSIRNYFTYRQESPDSVQYVLDQAKRHRPDVFISDFEGVVPVAARLYGKPLISIDNQHKFSRCTSPNLPWDLRLYAHLMGWYAEWLCPSPDYTVISTFYHSKIKKKHSRKTILTNCFMRKNIEVREPTKGDYLLLYFKTSVGDKMLRELARLDQRVVVFNCPKERRSVEWFEYMDVDNDIFVEYLAGCRAVFCSAGNQLLGEAIYYGKPIFCIPEPNQPEQSINAFYVKDYGYGATCSLKKFGAKKVKKFLDNFVVRNQRTPNGVYDAIKVIEGVVSGRN